MRVWIFSLALLLSVSAAVAACGSSDDGDSKGSGSGGSGGGGSPDNVGSVCKAPEDCYPKLDAATLTGAPQCLDRTDEGYCTHLCQSDADCCAVPGECETALAELCAPFESTGKNMCFLSCEKADLGGADPETYCQTNVSPDFGCRASGGGNPKKICFPVDCGVGETCGVDAECATGLVCLTSFGGGYCGKKDCAANADCPTGSLCVQDGASSYCALSCNGPSDCTRCRTASFAATCKGDATFVETGTTGSVCVPPTK